MPASCIGDCERQSRAALQASDALCDAKARDLTKHHDFFFQPEFVEQQFRILCYQAAQARVIAQLGACKFACLAERTGAQIAQ